jgi:hypothetical protein
MKSTPGLPLGNINKWCHTFLALEVNGQVKKAFTCDHGGGVVNFGWNLCKIIYECLILRKDESKKPNTRVLCAIIKYSMAYKGLQ